MESRHDSENAERILYNMRPKELVSMIVVTPVHPGSVIALTYIFFGYNICTTPAVCVHVQGGGDENGLPARGNRV